MAGARARVALALTRAVPTLAARHIPDGERRARLGARHHLAGPARVDDPAGVAGDLLGLHSSDPATVFLSAAARSAEPGAAVPALERALYDDRTLVRTLGMRRTLFVVPLELVAVVRAACTETLVAGERRRLVTMIEENGIARDGARWLRAVEAATLAALDRDAALTGAELSMQVPGLREKIAYGKGTTWAGTMSVTTRLLFLLSTEQRVARGRPKGSWTSSQYRWSLMARWLPDPLPPLDPGAARAELARRWLGAYGPGTAADLKWWTGWNGSQTTAALAGAGAVEVGIDGGSGWVLAGDEDPSGAPAPWVALLPGLDPTTMGWKERAWYLGDHGPALFDRNGNAGPTVWVDGRIVGAWNQRASGEVAVELLDDVGREAEGAVAERADELRKWLGDVRVKPRFPTPLQTALSRRAP